VAAVEYDKIFNSDQASQFTSLTFIGELERAGVCISMDGRGRWMENVFIERLWRSLKQEDIYLKGYSDGREARAGIASWIAFYSRRPNQALAFRLDDAVALSTCPQLQQQPQTGLIGA
jgi:putative transposase